MGLCRLACGLGTVSAACVCRQLRLVGSSTVCPFHLPYLQQLQVSRKILSFCRARAEQRAIEALHPQAIDRGGPLPTNDDANQSAGHTT